MLPLVNIKELDVYLGSVKGSVTLIDFEVFSPLQETLLQLRFSSIPHVYSSQVFFRTCGQIELELKAKDLVDIG